MDRVLSPLELWQDFDTPVEPLDCNVINSYTIDNVVTTQLYFSGAMLDNGQRVRIFGEVKYKDTASKKQALLLINSADKPIDSAELEFWANNGMVAMSIDYNGTSDSMYYTVYPEAINYCNYTQHPSVDWAVHGKTAKDTKWYHYVACSRRAITYLYGLDFVKGVSVLSVGEGSKIALPVMLDSRVQYGSVVFGKLNVEIDNSNSNEQQIITQTNDEQEVQQQFLQFESEQVWQVGISPQSYLPIINIPVYYVCCGNSSITDVESVAEGFARTNDSSRLFVLPNALDYLDNDHVQGIVRWLKGKTDVSCDATITSEQNNGQLQLIVNNLYNTQNTKLWYCRQPNIGGNNWVCANLQPTEDANTYVVNIPLYDANTKVLAVAVQEDDIFLSTQIHTCNVTNASAYTPSFVLYGGEENCSFVPINQTDRWHGAEIKIKRVKGYLDIYGIKGTSFGTFAIHDSAVKHVGSDAISFDICCDERQTLQVALVHNFDNDKEIYVAEVPLTGDGKWQRVTLSVEHFYRHTDGHSMPKDLTMDLMVFIAKQAFIINNVMLV